MASIIRDGVQIELTHQELRQIYYEELNQIDQEEILNALQGANDDGSYDEMIHRLKSDENFAKRVACRYRKYMDDYDDGDRSWACIKDAYDYIADQRNRVVGKKYKATRFNLDTKTYDELETDSLDDVEKFLEGADEYDVIDQECETMVDFKRAD